METESLYLAIVAVVSALSGVLIGGGSIAVILSRANASKELKDSTEELLAKLVPSEVVTQVNGIANRALDIVLPLVTGSVEFVESVTDGEPNIPTVG